MKRIKYRRLTPLLLSQLKAQEERIKMWAWIAKQHYIEPFEREEGSYLSNKLKSNENTKQLY